MSGAGRQKPLFSTAAVGGLANYWGQQFVRCSAADPWPTHLFRDHADYEQECGAIENLFSVTGGSALGFQSDSFGFRATIPRLLTGTADDTRAGLLSMRKVFRHLVARSRAAVFETRVDTFSHQDGSWVFHLDDSRSFAARRIILAAGVKGTAHLLLRSYPDLDAARFNDHAPWMLYWAGFRKLPAPPPLSAPFDFAAITLEKRENERCLTFASIYDMRRSDLNLILAAALGRSWPIFRNWRAPPGANLISPVQVWTAATFDTITIDASGQTADMRPRRELRPAEDMDLTATTNLLKTMGGRLAKIGATQPGFGFHYHRLEVKPAGSGYRGIADFLRERTGGQVVCADASVLDEIGCRPHTLTSMANARRITTAFAANPSCETIEETPGPWSVDAGENLLARDES